jgi:hypothetical protein
LFVTVPPRLFWYTQVLPTPIGKPARLVVVPAELATGAAVWLLAAAGELDEPAAEPDDEPQPARTSPAAANASAGPAHLRAR